MSKGYLGKGRGVDQSFALKIIVRKLLKKSRKLFAVSMGFKRAYDRVNKKSCVIF